MSDLISRQDIKYHVQLEAMGNGQYEEVEIAYRSDIESLPSVDRPTGEWVYGIDEETGEKDCYKWTCSICNEKYPWQPKFCPNCGAKMGGGE